MLLRLILGNAQVVTPGGSGEMSVPEILIKTVDLKSSLVLVGMGDFFEIWSAQAWSEQESRILESRSDPSRFSSLDLSLR
jgi:MraZ protein